jgi:ABC-type multidrug transport system permease subunit
MTSKQKLDWPYPNIEELAHKIAEEIPNYINQQQIDNFIQAETNSVLQRFQPFIIFNVIMLCLITVIVIIILAVVLKAHPSAFKLHSK